MTQMYPNLKECQFPSKVVKHEIKDNKLLCGKCKKVLVIYQVLLDMQSCVLVILLIVQLLTLRLCIQVVLVKNNFSIKVN